jgi:hypothetical protein
MSRLYLLIGFLILLLAATGCSEDPVTPPPGDDTSVRVDLDPEGADFTIKLEAVSTPDSLVRGPFFLRGYDLHYDDQAGALVVDLTITNNCLRTFLDPVSIAIHNILPAGTLILNSPDDSAVFQFDFANDDLWWTPGEESLPLTVMFGVDPGVSVGFNGHISVGGVQVGGMISGRVWKDRNQDGVMDPDEPGLPDVPIALDDGGLQEILHMAVTDRDGRYVFSGLEAGTYQVRVHMPPPEMTSTTSASMHVLLAPEGGGVSSFMDANFGFYDYEIILPGPRLVVYTPWDVKIAFRGETVTGLMVPPGVPLQFNWEGFADPGLEISAYQWGWDVIDPDDPNDIGWSGPPGLDPANMEALWGQPLEPDELHELVIQCWDNEDHLTRMRIRFWLDDTKPRDIVFD